MNEWLSARADELAKRSGIERGALELNEQEIDELLDLAGYAAHASGEHWWVRRVSHSRSSLPSVKDREWWAGLPMPCSLAARPVRS